MKMCLSMSFSLYKFKNNKQKTPTEKFHRGALIFDWKDTKM